MAMPPPDFTSRMGLVMVLIVHVTDDRKDIPEGANWVSAVEGDAINVYDYDCLDRLEELYTEVLFTLRGEYSIYVRCGTVFFLKI